MAEKLTPYSSGFHGKVSCVQHPVFWGADFVKEEVDPSSLQYKLTYYSHIITNTLFPGSVIDIIGANSREDLSLHRIYSKDACVCPSHAIYSQHMSMTDRGKANCCGCPDCISHGIQHVNGIDSSAIIKAAMLQDYGIALPWNDPSDYCVTADGRLIFFEIDGFDSRKLRRNLQMNGHGIAKKSTALKLLDRYEQLERENVHYFEMV